jgi:hypothetical protein
MLDQFYFNRGVATYTVADMFNGRVNNPTGPLVVKRSCKRVRIVGNDFAAHSLRSVLVTQAGYEWRKRTQHHEYDGPQEHDHGCPTFGTLLYSARMPRQRFDENEEVPNS